MIDSSGMDQTVQSSTKLLKARGRELPIRFSSERLRQEIEWEIHRRQLSLVKISGEAGVSVSLLNKFLTISNVVIPQRDKLILIAWIRVSVGKPTHEKALLYEKAGEINIQEEEAQEEVKIEEKNGKRRIVVNIRLIKNS